MTDSDIVVLLAALLCVALSFLFSGMETGVLALNRFRIRQQMRSGDRRAAVLHAFLENPEDFLWTILVGNTVVNFIIFSLWVMQLPKSLGHRRIAETVAFVAGVFMFYIVCELVPKTLFQRYPNRLSLAWAGPFLLVHRMLAPLVAVVAWFSRGLLRWTGGRAHTGRLFGSRDELRFIMQEAAPGLTTEERAMINRVLDLPNLRVRHVMLPLANVVSIADDRPLLEAIDLCRHLNLTRVPVRNRQGGRIVGIVNLESVLFSENGDCSGPVREHLQAVFFLQEDLHLEDALRRLQYTGARLAVVLGRDNREAGIITLQDVLKVIFGDVAL
jgi:putative hemolysin